MKTISPFPSGMVKGMELISIFSPFPADAGHWHPAIFMELGSIPATLRVVGWSLSPLFLSSNPFWIMKTNIVKKSTQDYVRRVANIQACFACGWKEAEKILATTTSDSYRSAVRQRWSSF